MSRLLLDVALPLLKMNEGTECCTYNSGEENKADALSDLMKRLELNTDEVAAVGDDMPDTGMYKPLRLKLRCRCPSLRSKTSKLDYDLPVVGAVREISDTILQAKGVANEIFGASV